MRRLFILCALIVTGITLMAQPTQLPASPASILKTVTTDSVKKKVETVKRVHKKMIMALDTLTLSDYTLSLERVNDNLNAIGDSSKLGIEVAKLDQRIDFMTKDVKLIRQNFKGRTSVIHLKNQYLYQSYTATLDDETNRLQAELEKLYLRVSHAKNHLKKALSDSIFRKLYANKELRTAFDDKLIRLEWKWNRTDSVTKTNLDTLNALKVRLSDNSLELSNMLNFMDKRLDKTVPRLFGKEVNYIWQKDSVEVLTKRSSRNAISIFKSEQNAISFYFMQTSGERMIVLVLAIVLFLWLFLKRKFIKILQVQKEAYSYLNLQYLNTHPVISLCVVLLCLMPFFDAYAPSSYVSIEYILLLAASSVILFKKDEGIFTFHWLGLGLLLIANSMAYLFVDLTLGGRLLQLAIHGGILLFILLFYRSLEKDLPNYKLIKAATLTGIILTGSGILFNLFGRFSLSGIVGAAGIYAVTQAVILTLFVEIIMEIILVQLQSSRLKKGVSKPFDRTVVIGKIKGPLMLVAILLWVVMLTSNLNLYRSLSNEVVEVLTSTRTIGSISFQLLSVILFFIIIWLAHILQRLISFLFGETGVELEDLSTITKGQHSRLLITRLLVLIGGYMLAIAASGLPIDKLTFLLGALGVGIGMGLQNIVNNFVSGIILIFDGSLQIGDEIEVNGQAGKVKEIGLRASTLSTPDGAEVIIPNGNVLSQNIVNWTFSNDEKRIMLTFSLAGKELDANVINDIINDTVRNIQHVIVKRMPVILYTKVTQESCSITVRFWSTISHAEQVKSEAMQSLSAAFHAKEIGFE